MSTKIFDAWRIPMSALDELVSLARIVRQIHINTIADETAKSLSLLLKFYSQEMDCLMRQGKKEVLNYVREILFPVLQLNKSNPTTVFSRTEQKFFDLLLKETLDKLGKSADDELRNAISGVFPEVLSFVSRSEPAVVFLNGDGGTTYAKGLGLSEAAKSYLDAHYQRFEYQDQCEEPFDRVANPELYDFLKERCMDDAAIPQKTWDKFFDILGWYSQEQRGRLWDRALAGETSLSRAGLTYGFFDWQFDLKKFAYQVVKKLLEEREKGETESDA